MAPKRGASDGAGRKTTKKTPPTSASEEGAGAGGCGGRGPGLSASSSSSSLAAAAAAAVGESERAEYRKLDQRQHVLLRPGMYIGSVHPEAVDAWVWDAGARAMTHVEGLRYTPGLHQIFLEILTNATDHALRHRVRAIRVDIDAAAGRIAVENDGPGISAALHAETGVHVPELIFGHMLTSSNYADGGGRTVAGQNGVGAKSANIFSRRFEVVTREGGVTYRQEWRDNMAAVGPPEVSRRERGGSGGNPRRGEGGSGGASFTRVTFEPDLARLGLAAGGGLDAGNAAMLRRSVVDAAAMTPAHTAVYLDGEAVPVKNFKGYVELYLGGDGAGDGGFAYEAAGGGDWEVAVAASPDGAFRQVSFVNGLWTPKGGKHVEHAATAVAKRLAERLSTRDRPVTNRAVRNALWLFVSARVPEPTFDSQNKHQLTTPPERFRSRYEMSDAMLRAVLARTGVADRVRAAAAASEVSRLRRSDGDQRRSVSGIPKLDDAVWAGTRRSGECTLILTEGDSAKSTAIAGLSVVGRERFGVFPLRGKLLNVRDCALARVGDNEEIKALKRILGLETGRDYACDAAFATLRYGAVLCLCDQDVDGFHIKGLLINLFEVLWPGLARRPGFLRAMATPIVRARRGAAAAAAAGVLNFYSLPEFRAWEAGLAGGERERAAWRVKYYKGLGSSTNEDAREYFRDMRTVRYVLRDAPAAPDGAKAPRPEPDASVVVRLAVLPDGEVAVRLCLRRRRGDADALDMAFGKARAAERKEWLNSVDRDAALTYGGGPDAAVPVADFVDLELAQFSWDDVTRSLPGAVDGLKKTQRKVVFAVKRAKPGETRVAQLAGFVSQVSGYHHGEASLQQTIVGMAQRFVGCGHVQLLRDSGQFGSRIMGGRDSASARYIHTEATAAFRRLFPDADEPLLERNLDDDRRAVEPVTYLPVLPLALLNGGLGIGTGYSTNVPCFSPALVAGAYRARLTGAVARFRDTGLADPPPCYRGFRGAFERDAATGRWASRGAWRRAGPRALEVTELPVGTWTADYKEMLEGMCAAGGGGGGGGGGGPTNAGGGAGGAAAAAAAAQAAVDGGLRRYDPLYTESDARFMLHFDSEASLDALIAAGPDALEAALRLRSEKGLSVTNMHLIDARGEVRCYASPADIAEEHYAARLAGYRRRLAHQTEALARAVAALAAKARFVSDVVEGRLETRGAPLEALVRYCEDCGFPRAASDTSNGDEGADADAAAAAAGTPEGGKAAADRDGRGDFAYVLNMPVSSLTAERHARLLREVEGAERRLAELRATTVQAVWLSEIDALMAAVEEQAREQEREREQPADATAGAAADAAATAKRNTNKKQTTKKAGGAASAAAAAAGKE